MIEKPISSDVFSTFVRASAAGEALDDQFLERVWHQLRAALMQEIRRRGLWNASPAYLGVFGFRHWSDEALDELVVDCFTFVFIHRLHSLIAQAAVKPSVTGLVVLSLRNFLHDRQRKHDPLGFRIFSALRSSVRQAVERGDVFILEGDPEIRNETVLGFSTPTSVDEPSEAMMAEAIRNWSDDLLPDLITASGRQWQGLHHRLLDHLVSLRAIGIQSFRFRQVVEPLKADVRARWAALWGQDSDDKVPGSGSELSFMARTVGPDRTFEDRDSYESLVGCVSALLERAIVSEKDRRYLQTLWGYVRAYAADQLDQRDSTLSYRQLAAFLGIPRARLGSLFETLGKFVRHCDGGFSKPSAAGVGIGSPSQDDQQAR